MALKKLPLSEESRTARITSLVLAILFVSFGLAVPYVPGFRGTSDQFVSGICYKLAILLGLMWLAWPQLARLRQMPGGKIILGTVALIGLVVVFRPKSITALIPILVAGSGILMTLLWLQRIFSPPRR